MLLFGVASVALSVIGPKILGQATDLIFAGVVGQQMPAGSTKAQVVEGCGRDGNEQRWPTCSRRCDVVPGQGIDFDALGHVLLLGAGALPAAPRCSALFQGRLTTGVVQRLVFRLREQVQAKLSRLPLRYFDQQQRGEVLSRATNDTDNIAQTLQQTMSQLLTSLLTIVGVLVMMFWISPLLAVIALVTVPVSVVVAATDRQAGAAAVRPAVVDHRQAERPHRGDVHRARAGEGVRPAATSRSATSTSTTRSCTTASFRAQFISGIIQPAMMFIGNLNYVLVAVVGGLRVATGAHLARRRAGVHPVLAPVQPAA